MFLFSTHICFLSMHNLFYTLADEKKLVDQVFTNAIDCLSEDDKKLPQVSFAVLYTVIVPKMYDLPTCKFPFQ